MKRVFLTLGLTAALLVVACGSQEQCVADCDARGSTGTPVETSSTGEPTTGEPSTGDVESAACREATEAATEFIEQNRECETLLDCDVVSGLCYSGPAPNVCGGLGVAVDADLGVWEPLEEAMLESCQCGADPCGAVPMCDDNQCQSSFGAGNYCPSVEEDVQTFLAAHRACEFDEDCMQLTSTCYVDDCSVVAVNVETDPADWARLDDALRGCDLPVETYCNFVGDCGVEVRCGESGQCEAN
ncbi:MAG: hypothetical protein ACRBN8_40950 [Nannocystales bacterium]